jgi:hypothetical protein
MQYFDEQKMGEIRNELEKEILQWPGVSCREMMGCLCYLHGKKLSKQEEADLSKLSKKMAFKMAGKSFRKPVWELKTPKKLQTILPFLEKSYRATGRIKK